jgi:hypothetical protein
MWSSDGTSWEEVPGGMWKAPDGNWYKVEADGSLMMSADNGQTWTEAEQFVGNSNVWYKWENGTLMMMQGDAVMDDSAMTEEDVMMDDGQ